MMKEVLLLQSAQADILEIIARCGEGMYHRIDETLDVVRKMPEIGSVYHGSFRRKLVAETPFGVFYSVAGERIVVSFVLDLRQDPEAILERLRLMR